jgi:hypothetical protein
VINQAAIDMLLQAVAELQAGTAVDAAVVLGRTDGTFNGGCRSIRPMYMTGCLEYLKMRILQNLRAGQ